jgi:hypothetical protein
VWWRLLLLLLLLLSRGWPGRTSCFSIVGVWKSDISLLAEKIRH